MRARRLLWLGLVVAVLAPGCGDDDGRTTTPDQATTTTTETTGADGVLTVGSEIPYPPFEAFDAAGDIVGFDVDLVEEMARRLGLEVEWIDTEFDTIFIELATGVYDVVASAAPITPRHAQQVSFTMPYYNAQQALVVNTDVTPGLRSVDRFGQGLRVAVQTGTPGAVWAAENLTPLGVDIFEFPYAPDTYDALGEGEVDGVLNDEPTAVSEITGHAGLEIVDLIDTNQKYGFGVDPARPELLAELDRVLQEMIEDGTYQQIYDTWFDAPAGSITYVAPTTAPLTQTAGLLTVGSDISQPPFEYLDAAGDPIGFEVDLIEEMAARLGLEVEWVDTDADTILRQLTGGIFDVVASATTITPERAAQAGFTVPHYRANLAVVIDPEERPDLTDHQDLGDGDSVAVRAETTGAEWAAEILVPLGVDVFEFPSTPDLYETLTNGDVDGIVDDGASVGLRIAGREDLAVLDVIGLDAGYGFAVDPALPRLLAELDRVLQGMIDDGTYQEIYDTWFDVADGSVAADD